MNPISLPKIAIYAFATLVVCTSLRARSIILNNCDINDCCKPGELFVYRNTTTSSISIQIYDGKMSIEAVAPDNEQNMIDRYTKCTQDANLCTDALVQNNDGDLCLRKIYKKNQTPLTLSTDEILDIAASIIKAPVVTVKAYRIKFADCFVDTTMLHVQPNNPYSIVNEIMFIFDGNAKHPSFVQGYIDFQADEPSGKLVLHGAREVQISFKPEAFDNSRARDLGLNYGTHMACLMAVATNSTGPILEMGAGDYSTPLLHAVCAKDKRYLLSTDTDKRWLSHFADLETDWHELKHVKVYEDDWSRNPQPQLWDAIGGDKHWSIVFIDHRPGERRAFDIGRLRLNTDIFIVHDTEHSGYHYEPLLSSFKYRYVDTRYSTYTTVVSDRVNVKKFFRE